MATLIRFGHFTKPKCLVTSTAISAEHVRTVEISMIFRSKPSYTQREMIQIFVENHTIEKCSPIYDLALEKFFLEEK